MHIEKCDLQIQLLQKPFFYTSNNVIINDEYFAQYFHTYIFHDGPTFTRARHKRLLAFTTSVLYKIWQQRRREQANLISTFYIPCISIQCKNASQIIQSRGCKWGLKRKEKSFFIFFLVLLEEFDIRNRCDDGWLIGWCAFLDEKWYVLQGCFQELNTIK